MNLIVHTIYNSKDTKQPKCPLTEEWIKKVWHIYTMEYYSATKKNKMMPLAATWRGLKIITLSEVSQRKKNINDSTYILNIKKNDTNELIYRTVTDSET